MWCIDKVGSTRGFKLAKLQELWFMLGNVNSHTVTHVTACSTFIKDNSTKFHALSIQMCAASAIRSHIEEKTTTAFPSSVSMIQTGTYNFTSGAAKVWTSIQACRHKITHYAMSYISHYNSMCCYSHGTMLLSLRLWYNTGHWSYQRGWNARRAMQFDLAEHQKECRQWKLVSTGHLPQHAL